jgi:hypothetical protein
MSSVRFARLLRVAGSRNRMGRTGLLGTAEGFPIRTTCCFPSRHTAAAHAAVGITPMSLHRLVRSHLFLIVCLLGTTTSNVAFAQTPGQSQLGGWVYIDRNNDGVLAFLGDPNPEFVIGDVSISLFSKVGSVETLVSTVQSDQFGRYRFQNIDPGTYVLRETPPIEFVDGIDTLGILQSLNGQPIPSTGSVGVMTDNTFSDIVLTPDVGGEFYNFGERGLKAGFASKRFFFGSTPPPPQTFPPPETFPPPGDPPLPEPASLMLALIAGCASLLTVRRARPC